MTNQYKPFVKRFYVKTALGIAAFATLVWLFTPGPPKSLERRQLEHTADSLELVRNDAICFLDWKDFQEGKLKDKITEKDIMFGQGPRGETVLRTGFNDSFYCEFDENGNARFRENMKKRVRLSSPLSVKE